MPDDENTNQQPQPPKREQTDCPSSSNATTGFVAASRTPDVMELIRANPLAYVLAAVIAYRARWSSGFNQYGLKLGEALIGDHAAYGLTRQQFRTAVRQLQKWGFATFNATSKGTVAKLVDNPSLRKRPHHLDTMRRRTPTRRAASSCESPSAHASTRRARSGVVWWALEPMLQALDVDRNPTLNQAQVLPCPKTPVLSTYFVNITLGVTEWTLTKPKASDVRCFQPANFSASKGPL